MLKDDRTLWWHIYCTKLGEIVLHITPLPQWLFFELCGRSFGGWSNYILFVQYDGTTRRRAEEWESLDLPAQGYASRWWWGQCGHQADHENGYHVWKYWVRSWIHSFQRLADIQRYWRKGQKCIKSKRKHPFARTRHTMRRMPLVSPSFVVAGGLFPPGGFGIWRIIISELALTTSLTS